MTSVEFQRVVGAYRELFWPTFIEHDGCVFLSRSFDEAAYRDWQRATGGDKAKIEAVMNHVHVLDELPAEVEAPTRGLVVEFGRLLCETWQCKLRRDFPARHFSVDFPSDELADLLGYEVTFYQVADQ